MYTGPNLTNDGLVFGYDTGYGIADNNTSTRFYPGEPTTNLQSSNQTSGQIAGMQGVTLTYVGEEDGYSKYSMTGTFSAGTYPYCMYLPGVSFTGGTTYSTQVKLKTNVPHKFNYIGGGINYVNQAMNNTGTNSSVLQSDGFNYIKREGFNYVSTTTQSGYIHSNPVNNTTFSSSTDFIYVKHFQIEQNTQSTPWTLTSRSSTQSLIDLKRTKDIDVSNVSFDSTGQPTFDGTDDTISFNPGTFPTNWSQPFSIEAVVYIPAGATWYNQGSGTNIIGRGSYTGSWGLFRGGTNNSVYFYIRTGSNTFNPGGIIGRDKHYHIVGTWDGISQAIFYINGNQNSQETSTSVGTTVGNTGDIRVGGNIAFGGSNGGYGEGTYPVIKLYSKKLTADEIMQNYNAYKNRFNI